MTRRAVAAVTMVAAAVVTVTGCAKPASTPTAAPAATASTAPVAPPTSSSHTAKWTDLKPGDCLSEPPPTDPAVVMVTVVDCATQHVAEVYLRAGIPVDTALSGTANAQCSAGLAQYTGMPAADSYAITYLIDSDQDRTSNNPYPSTVICLLQRPQGQPLTGSTKH